MSYDCRSRKHSVRLLRVEPREIEKVAVAAEPRFLFSVRFKFPPRASSRIDWMGFLANATLTPRVRALRARVPGAPPMKFLGFLLLLAGWGIVLTAIALLAASAPRAAFALSGIGVEILGLILVIRAHPAPRGEHE
jgi:hypothetical protein